MVLRLFSHLSVYFHVELEQQTRILVTWVLYLGVNDDPSLMDELGAVFQDYLKIMREYYWQNEAWTSSFGPKWLQNIVVGSAK